MSQFKVGQRVRIVGCVKKRNRRYVGMEGVVLEHVEDWFGVGCVVRLANGEVGDFLNEHLAPATPPAEWTWQRVQSLESPPDFRIPAPVAA